MYSTGCLATGWDAGQAFLHKGESNGGTYPVCAVHSMQEVGPARTTKVSTCNVRTEERSGSEKARNSESVLTTYTVPPNSADSVKFFGRAVGKNQHKTFLDRVLEDGFEFQGTSLFVFLSLHYHEGTLTGWWGGGLK